jgi:hypothetical protein
VPSAESIVDTTNAVLTTTGGAPFSHGA